MVSRDFLLFVEQGKARTMSRVLKHIGLPDFPFPEVQQASVPPPSWRVTRASSINYHHPAMLGSRHDPHRVIWLCPPQEPELKRHNARDVRSLPPSKTKPATLRGSDDLCLDWPRWLRLLCLDWSGARVSQYAPMDKKVRAKLRAFYEPHNKVHAAHPFLSTTS